MANGNGGKSTFGDWRVIMGLLAALLAGGLGGAGAPIGNGASEHPVSAADFIELKTELKTQNFYISERLRRIEDHSIPSIEAKLDRLLER